MDIKREPGIHFDDILLKNLSFERQPDIAQEPELSVSFEAVEAISEDEKMLSLELKCNVHEANNSFKIDCTMIGFFSVSDEPNMNLKEFAKVNAPAIMFPYIREVISSTTARAGINPIVLPPTNIGKMINKK